MHFYVDGYNLLYALPEIPAGDGKAKRDALLRYLVQTRPQGNNPMTVVFDSYQGFGDQQQFQGIQVVYAAGESADDWLSRKVREVQNPRNCCVVTDDKGIKRMIGGTGAKWMSAEEFLGF